jgi:uncharacterized membrane protein
MVTRTRVVIGSQTFAIANITSVNIARVDDNSLVPPGCMIAGALLVLVGIVMLLSGAMWDARQLPNYGSLVLVGALMFLGGWKLAQGNKTKWSLVLRTSGSEMRVLTSPDKDLIGKAAEAVSTAMIARG